MREIVSQEPPSESNVCTQGPIYTMGSGRRVCTSHGRGILGAYTRNGARAYTE